MFKEGVTYMARKSQEPNLQSKGTPRVIVIKNNISVNDFIPDYKFTYDIDNLPLEPLEMAESFETFLRENEDLVLENYSSEDVTAIQEGFKRAVAITELFFKSLYLD